MPRSARAASVARPSPRTAAGLAALALLGLAGAGCATTPKRAESTYVWPLPPDPPRIRWVRNLVREGSLEGGAGRAFLRVFVPEAGENAVRNPTGVALSPDETRLYVACGPVGRVLEFDLARGRVRAVADAEGYRPAFASDVAVDGEGRIYVSDSSQGVVWAYDQQGAFRTQIGKGVLDRPISMALDRKRQVLYVVDGGDPKGQNHQVAAFSLAGQHLRTIGKRGGAPGEFNFPSRAAVAADGSLYVADTLNFRIQVFDPEGGLAGVFGSQGTGAGQFLKVKGLAFDAFGNLHVADTEQGIVQILNPARQPLMAYGGRAARPEFMQTPGALVIDSKGNVYVTDYSAGWVNQYQLFNVTAEDSFKAVGAPSGKADAAPQGARP